MPPQVRSDPPEFRSTVESADLSAFLAAAAASTDGGPLHYAVLHGSAGSAHAAARHLLAAGVDPNRRDALGRSALHLAALVGDAPMAALLLATPGTAAARRCESGATPLHYCFWPATLTQALQEAGTAAGSPVGASGGEAGDEMAGHMGCQPRSTTHPDRLAVARLLLPHLAAGQTDLATAMEGSTPLMHAATAGSAPAVALLLGAAADRDAQDARGRSALMLAAAGGCLDALALLLEPGGEGDEAPRPRATLDLQDEQGNTALCLAISTHQLPAVELLLAAQARLDLVSPPLLAQLVGLLFAGKQDVEGELQSAMAARSNAIAAGAAAVAERDTAQRALQEAEQARAAQEEQLQAAQASAATNRELMSRLKASEQATAQLSAEVRSLNGELRGAKELASSLQQQLDAACHQLLLADKEHLERVAERTAGAEQQRSEAEAEAQRLRSEVQSLTQAAEARQLEMARLEGRAEQLRRELDAERRRGFWSRLFGSRGGKRPVSGPYRPSPARAGGAKVVPILRASTEHRASWTAATKSARAAHAPSVSSSNGPAASAAHGGSTNTQRMISQPAGGSPEAAASVAQQEQDVRGEDAPAPAPAPVDGQQNGAHEGSLPCPGKAECCQPGADPPASGPSMEVDLHRLMRELAATRGSTSPNQHGLSPDPVQTPGSPAAAAEV